MAEKSIITGAAPADAVASTASSSAEVTDPGPAAVDGRGFWRGQGLAEDMQLAAGAYRAEGKQSWAGEKCAQETGGPDGGPAALTPAMTRTVSASNRTLPFSSSWRSRRRWRRSR